MGGKKRHRSSITSASAAGDKKAHHSRYLCRHVSSSASPYHNIGDALAGKMADPLRPYPCEMAHSVGVFERVEFVDR